LIKMMATVIPSTKTKNIVLINEMVKIIKEYNLGTTQTWANYKQSYLLGFSSDVSGAMSGKHNLVLSKMTDVLLRLNQGVIDEFGTPVADHKYDWFKTMIKANIAPSSTDAAIKTTATAAVTLFKDLKDSGIFTLHPVKVTSQMGTLGKNNHPTYGYGLGVFFIAVGMWIGAIVMTFAVHSKVHDKTVHPTKRYLIKFSIIALGIFIQSTILMTTLWFIGYSEIGIGHWFTLYMGVTVSSIVFAAIVQAIRFTIPNRVFGIFMVIILLVLQIAASGGLFPYETQAGFYRGLHHILPMTYAINISREALFDTNWNNIFMNFGYLFIFLFTIPLGIVIKNRQDAAYYKKMDWQLPEVKGGKNV
ncbi:MAG: YhgE/Pip family protein, partial [Mycoplasmataceae bacterium]|nr:YhgE/Pip family protein [Mycoplasmataceae bacterium]